MKKWFCVLLVLIFMLPGCAKEEPMENPVRFYYCRSDISYFDSTGAVGSELREGIDWPLESASGYYRLMLKQYVQGPEDSKLDRTFPKNTAVQEVVYFGDTVKIVLSQEFAQLTGIDLSLARACLALTACEMTGAKKAQISAEGALLDGSSMVTMVYDQLVLEDLCRVPVEPN